MLATDLREAGVDLSAFACLSGIPLDVPRIAVLEAIV
jgi:hypothetical protein